MTERSLQESAALVAAKPIYLVPRQDLAGEVLIPSFQHAEEARCMVGFFSSAILRDLAPGLASYINLSDGPFRLIMSPLVSEVDQAAIDRAIRDPSKVITDIFAERLLVTSDLENYTLRCFSFLIATKRIEIKIALMRNGLFHPKVWLFDAGGDRIAVHGSSNMTHSAIRTNKEQITVSKSWADPTQRYIANELSAEFESIWSDRDDECRVFPLPQAIADQLLSTYPPTSRPTEEEFRRLGQNQSEVSPSEQSVDFVPKSSLDIFLIPKHLRYDSGAFAHQGNAVKAWVDNGFRGTLEMATGSGKTIAAMLCTHELFRREKPLLVVISAPYIPLIEQWCDEVRPFGIKPVNLSTASNSDHRRQLIQASLRRLRLNLSEVEVLVVSHDTLCTPDFMGAIETFQGARLLIADEAHNLGRNAFIQAVPAFVEHRLALSATPIRQYDADGSAALLDFFGEVVFKFSLKDAIGNCLVPYDYFVHPVDLSATEMDDWRALTAKIKQSAWRSSGGKPDEYVAKLLRDRRELLETAEGKVQVFSDTLDQEDLTTLRHTLVYCTDKSPAQLDEVNALLSEKGVLFHQLTAKETADRSLTKNILDAFRCGEIQVLTAKRVLDEGVNIPQIQRAFILASTTVERQWIQRRGRVLRLCPEIGKVKSTIHDFIALPGDISLDLDDDSKSVVKSELGRMQEFASLARNAGMPGGPLHLIHQLVSSTLM